MQRCVPLSAMQEGHRGCTLLLSYTIAAMIFPAISCLLHLSTGTHMHMGQHRINSPHIISTTSLAHARDGGIATVHAVVPTMDCKRWRQCNGPCSGTNQCNATSHAPQTDSFPSTLHLGTDDLTTSSVSCTHQRTIPSDCDDHYKQTPQSPAHQREQEQPNHRNSFQQL